jgi:hypothetical protein
MRCLRAQSTSTWAEDTALLRSNRSAVPGVGADGRVGALSGSAPCTPSSFNTKAPNLRGTTPRPFDRMSSPQLTNADQSEFQFPLNKYTVGRRFRPVHQ